MDNTARFTVFDYCLIVGIIAVNLIYSVLTSTIDLIGSITSVAGVVCVVMVAKGNIWNYLFGVINVSLYAYVSYKSELYGDAVLNAFYYLPMQFIGLWQWKRRGASGSEKAVSARRMTTIQRILLITGCAVLTFAGGLLLKHLGDPQPYKDAATTILSIIAQFLMVMAFAEQWLLWIVTNVISVVMWTICVAHGESHAELMVLMWVFYLLNSINGLRVWLKRS